MNYEVRALHAVGSDTVSYAFGIGERMRGYRVGYAVYSIEPDGLERISTYWRLMDAVNEAHSLEEGAGL